MTDRVRAAAASTLESVPRDRRSSPRVRSRGARLPDSAAWPHHETQDRLRVSGVRLRSRRSGSAAAPSAASGTARRGARDARGGRGGRAATPAPATRWRAAGPRLYDVIDTVVVGASPTGIDEFDRVLGRRRRARLAGAHRRRAGHRQVARCCCRRRRTSPARAGAVLYVSGEESEHQIKSRGERLGHHAGAALPARGDLPRAHPRGDRAAEARALVVVDSIQTVFSLEFQSAPGSVGQVREVAPRQLLIAGQGAEHPDLPHRPRHQGRHPRRARRSLEHIVDTVLYFEGEKHHSTASCAR